MNTKKIKLIRIGIIAASCVLFAHSALAQTWLPFANTAFHEPPQLVRAGSFGSQFLFTASRGNLFVSQDNGKTWERTLRVNGTEIVRINSLEIFERSPNTWYALTTEGLFQSFDSGKSWAKIYDGIGTNNRNVLSLAQNPNQRETLYLGTAEGVLISKDGGKSWSRAFAELSKKQIWGIAIDERNQELYFATSGGAFRYHLTQDRFRQIFTESLFVSESEVNENETSSNQNETESNANRLKIIISINPLFSLVVTTKNGVFTSNDEGETWQRLPAAGLQNLNISDVVYSDRAQTLFAATTRGIFKYNLPEKKWDELYEGLPTTEALSLTIQKMGAKENLIAATKSGVFYYEIEPPSFKSEVHFQADSVTMEKLSRLFQSEPSVRQVQREAISYANVGNGKIKRWHTGSRIRSLVPNLTFSKGLDVSNNLHVDTGSTTVPDSFVQGPDDRGRSTDLNLSWNLGDLIWSSSQTSIDSREKLMVELRDEILAEVTRLYFERRRTQLEFITNPPQDSTERAKMLFRIDELTANLDALTDGYLSKRLDRIYKQHPELNELWQIAKQEM